MKKLLNTLYITSRDAYLHRQGETVVVKIDGEERIRVPIHNLDSIICFGPMTCSTPLMELCGTRNVHLAFFSEYGKFYARVEGPIHGNVLLRKRQFAVANQPDLCTNLAKSFVLAKMSNSRNVLLRAAREHIATASDELKSAAGKLTRIAQTLPDAANVSVLRGIEGEAARTYFSVFNHLIVAQKEDFYYSSRSRRPNGKIL